jgi:hypothetical protein
MPTGIVGVGVHLDSSELFFSVLFLTFSPFSVAELVVAYGKIFRFCVRFFTWTLCKAHICNDCSFFYFLFFTVTTLAVIMYFHNGRFSLSIYNLKKTTPPPYTETWFYSITL